MCKKMLADKVKECGSNYGMNVYDDRDLLGIITGNDPNAFPERLEDAFLNPASIDGIGEKKALVLNSVMELAKRLSARDARKVDIIHGPEDVFEYCRPKYMYEQQEHFAVMMLNMRNKITGYKDITKGSLSASIVAPRDVFREAVLASAAAIIVIHNHPSGDPSPSKEDIAVTQRLVKAGKIMDIPVLDHIIIARDRYYSMKETGMLHE